MAQSSVTSACAVAMSLFRSASDHLSTSALLCSVVFAAGLLRSATLLFCGLAFTACGEVNEESVSAKARMNRECFIGLPPALILAARGTVHEAAEDPPVRWARDQVGATLLPEPALRQLLASASFRQRCYIKI